VPAWQRNCVAEVAVPRAQCLFDAGSMELIPGASEDLKKDQVVNEERFVASSSLEFLGRGRLMPAQMRNPD